MVHEGVGSSKVLMQKGGIRESSGLPWKMIWGFLFFGFF